MRRITYFLLIAVFLIIPVGATSSSHADVEYIQKSNFWTWAAGEPGTGWNKFIGYTFGVSCPNSEDGYHHASSYRRPEASWGGPTGYYKCICDLCGAEFTAYEKDLQQSYDAQVAELPAPSYNSDGSLYIQGVHDGIRVQNAGSGIGKEGISCTHTSYLGYSGYDGVGHFNCENNSLSVVPKSGSSHFSFYYVEFLFKISSPLDGYYILMDNPSINGFMIVNDTKYDLIQYWIKNSSIFYNKGSKVSASSSAYSSKAGPFDRGVNSSLVSAACSPPVYKVIPLDSLVNEINATYNITSRPTSITGDYGIIGDNGQIIKVEGDKIVNETNNTIYNPATGETHTMSDWSYNYEDRSYTVTTETGDTITITYGDENVTIKEGDTIYNVYYLVDGSGEPGPDVPGGCNHIWTETGRTEPACTTAGKVTSTCSKCNQTKTETIPATGHNWVVDRTVQTTYDEEGNLLQQGYTIYSCSVCGEQYKDMEGTGPPGSEEEKSIWEKLGDLIGSGFGGIIEIIEAILGKILDALTSLVNMITDKFKGIVESILSIFDELPALFGGFLDFLAAIFPFLPPEITSILTFGVIAITFIGILKAVRR